MLQQFVTVFSLALKWKKSFVLWSILLYMTFPSQAIAFGHADFMSDLIWSLNSSKRWPCLQMLAEPPNTKCTLGKRFAYLRKAKISASICLVLYCSHVFSCPFCGHTSSKFQTMTIISLNCVGSPPAFCLARSLSWVKYQSAHAPPSALNSMVVKGVGKRFLVYPWLLFDDPF